MTRPLTRSQFSTAAGSRLRNAGGFLSSGSELPQPDVVVQAPLSVASSQPAVVENSDALPAQTQVPLASVVGQYVENYRRDYVEKGWLLFGQGNYRQACDVFSIAQAASVDDQNALVTVRVALFHAAVASRQHALALNTLRWLISRHPRTKQFPDERVMEQLGNVAGRYKLNATDYVSHVTLVEQLANQPAAPVELQALRAAVLWGNNSRSRAIQHAEKLAGPQGQLPWSDLLDLMQRASQPPELAPGAGLPIPGDPGRLIVPISRGY